MALTTAEKRAQLIREGGSWPDCDCHGEPCYWQKDDRSNAGGRFVCAVGSRRSHQRAREERLAKGGCIYCGGPLATGIRCARHAEEHAAYQARAYQRLQNRAAAARYRQKIRGFEGFQSTGIGFAAVAHVRNRGAD